LKKYLFFYLKTGGGHLAPAKAVAEKIKNKKKNEVEIILADGLAKANPIIRYIIEDGYRNSVNKAVWVFEFLYALHKIRLISVLSSYIVSWFIEGLIEKEIMVSKPEKIVIFHFFLITPVYNVIERNKLYIPVITVVTDPFTAHPIWFIRKDQNYILFSDMLKEKCISKGLDNKRMKVFPFVLDQRYSRQPGRVKQNVIRKKLGFSDDSKVILIMGGGDGMPRGKKILKSIIINNINAEVAVVCGRNRKMYDHICKIKRKYSSENLKIYGFIDNVHELISISDIVITKCGASTFMEILLLGKVQIINNYIWEQEKGNKDFICKKDMGIFEKNTKKIPAIVSRLLNDEDFYKSHVANIRKASICNGVGPVSEYLINFNTQHEYTYNI